MADYTPFTIDGGDASTTDSGADSAPDSGSGAAAFFLGGSAPSGGTGATDASGTEFDPERHVGRDKFNADGTFTKKRGRRASGASSGRRSGKASDNSAGIDSLSKMLGIVHLGIATATKTPELAISDEESELLAQATARVMEEFDIVPDPKVQAVVGLITACGVVYGPKVYFIKERKKAEKAERDGSNG